MNKFKSVKITHNVKQRIDFSYLAEFFRFIGIFVCEEIMTEPDEKTKAETHTVYSACVFVGKRELQEEDADILNISVEDYGDMIAGLPVGTVYLNDFVPDSEEGLNCTIINLEPEEQKSILHDFLDGLLETVYEPGDAESFGAEQLKELIDIYVKQKIWLHSLNLQYYGRRPSEVISKAEDCFLTSQDAIQKTLEGKKNKNESYLYEYAMLWCQVKANSACHYNREILYFSIEKLSERCRKLYETFPGFTNALILLGLSYEPSSCSANEAVIAYMRALEEIEQECFASSVYYWIGKRYEAYRDKRNKAYENYALAYQRRPKFRNIFKLAITARDKGDTAAALKVFDRIPARLEEKRRMHFTDPLELEYLFKVYFQQSLICYQNEDYVKAMEYGLKGKDVWEKEIDESHYFEALYGEGKVADDYRKVLRKRLGIVKEYWILVDCCLKAFDKESAERYRERARDLKAEEVEEQALLKARELEIRELLESKE